jgi:DNA-directed RNA polymerase specialized sigma24 family protein
MRPQATWAAAPPTESFEAFYAASVDSVYRALAATVGDLALAREATDEAMARAYGRWSKVRELANPGGWVYRVGLNWATSVWRRVRRELPWSAASTVHVQVDGSDATAALAALRRLPVPYRAVVVCRVLLDLSTVDTALALGVPEGTVKSRLARALAALRAQLGDEER